MGYGSFSILGFYFGIISIMICLGGIVCCAILFYKLWGMCSDVHRILQILEQNRLESKEIK